MLSTQAKNNRSEIDISQPMPWISLSVPLFSLALTECLEITKEKCGTASLNASSFRWFRILRGYATLSEKRQERIGRAVADV